MTRFNPELGLLFLCFAIAPWVVRGTRDIKLDETDNLPSSKKLHASPLMPNPQFAADVEMPLHILVMEEARKSIQNLRMAANAASGEMGENLRAMVMSLDRIERDLIADPSEFSHVQRLFTYYLHATIEILDARGRAATNLDEDKLSAIDAIIARLASAFKNFALRLHAADARSIEIDIKLLDQSLAEEFGFENLRDQERNTSGK